MWLKRWQPELKNAPYLKRESQSLYFEDVLKLQLKLYRNTFWSFSVVFLNVDKDK